MTNYCVYCYKIINWASKEYGCYNWYEWKLAGSAHNECFNEEHGL